MAIYVPGNNNLAKKVNDAWAQVPDVGKKQAVDIWFGGSDGTPELVYRNMSLKFAAEYASLSQGTQIISMNQISKLSDASSDYTSIIGIDETTGLMYEIKDPGFSIISSESQIDTSDEHYKVSSLYYGINN